MAEATLTPTFGGPAVDEDQELIAALRAGDEHAFVTLVERYGGVMLRVALSHVRTRAVAEEVVQEAWCGVLTGIGRFEGRSSLKTWIFRILTNRAKTRGQREQRCVPFSSLARDDDDGPAVAADRFAGARQGRQAGQWAAPPRDWRVIPHERLQGKETLSRVREAIEGLPARQQEVIVLRDVEGWTAGEACESLGLSDGNQRVLLHRARSGVRASLEQYFDGEPSLV
jgi:RNA polymerase sigma-70 factor, ECF subfamily